MRSLIKQSPLLSRNAATLHSLPQKCSRGRLQTRRALQQEQMSTTLADVSFLKSHLEEVSILDCRLYDAYLEGHVPEAVHINLESVGSEAGTPLCDDPSTYIPMLESKGVDGIKPTVVYDDGSECKAALVWCALKVWRHPMPLVLQGGYHAWLEGEGKEELYEPCPLKLSTQYEAPDEPDTSLLNSEEECQKALITPELACQLRNSRPKTLDELLKALDAHRMPSDNLYKPGMRQAFLASSHADLPYACYVAILFASLTTEPWSVGVQA